MGPQRFLRHIKETGLLTGLSLQVIVKSVQCNSKLCDCDAEVM